MVISMTGYGRGIAENSSVKVAAEIKTVNHRFCEYNIRMPRQILVLEEKLKKKANEYIRRGRAEIMISIDGAGMSHKTLELDWGLAEQYFTLMDEASRKFQLTSSASASDLLQIEGMFAIRETAHDPDAIEPLLMDAFSSALDALRKMRVQEGTALAKDLGMHLKKFAHCLQSLKDYAPAVAQHYKKRLADRMMELSGNLIEEGRLLTEVAIFSDRSDITEEITRLESHLAQFSGTLNEKEPVGRKLDFLVQEMNREVNTIGSKSSDAAIAQNVVQLKSFLEKMKEQVQNIE
ncbi:YicC/YloC family endoribonuclease [Bacillus sp. MUM 13]|uniref:YicC/YloC family endoribonuclease n=1 Tax=Bacillus sp. MUM 13 TaxID=1678001 RepID=UPI0008F59096|nr:YicC/YloC family endoribonuclease [Bacillus sp. MUM 13]OIK15222.1 YicC family protein [Bacillus sp. MUM 13]